MKPYFSLLILCTVKAHYTQTGQYDYGQLTVPKIKSHAGFKN